RIVGGHPLSISKAPWQVAILLYGFQFCGGAIYSDRFILTAAHCMVDRTAKELSVRAGSSHWLIGGQQAPVAKILRHHKYKKVSGADPYDIAMLYLQTTLKLGKHVKTISLAKKTPDPGTKAFVSGWGRRHSHFSQGRILLRGVDVVIEDHLKCTLALASYNKVVTKDNLCAAAPGKDACQGDSGGPLVDIKSGELIGIISWGVGCADSKYPGIYADVSFFQDWIAGSSKQNSGGTVVKVAAFKYHESYNNDADNDVAVIKLKEPLALNRYIKSIPLAKTDPAEGSQALSTGWGISYLIPTLIPIHLQGVNLKIASKTWCRIKYPFKVHSADICAGYLGKAVCNGDSGGPLVVNGKLVGIVSRGGRQLCLGAGLYASVAHYRDWILKAIKSI
ncbi:hypothetical protein KR032_004354, partial [Drosophila birchii]